MPELTKKSFDRRDKVMGFSGARLTRGEPAEIVIHNRLDVPISVHRHGLELRSLYDGVGHWSGMPGAARPPIPPGDSASVIIEPPPGHR